MFAIRLSRLQTALNLVTPLSRSTNRIILTPNICLRNNSAVTNSSTNNYSKSKTDQKTEVGEKDRILFYNEKPSFYRVLNMCAIVQFFFWVQFAEFIYTRMKDVKTTYNEDSPWWRKFSLADDKTRMVVSITTALMGLCTMGVACIFTMRSVRLLVLRKDKKTLSIVTYGPFNKNIQLDVPLDKVSTSITRMNAKTQLPLKVQGKWFFYSLDTKSGTFKNPELFDYTAGMTRILKN